MLSHCVDISQGALLSTCKHTERVSGTFARDFPLKLILQTLACVHVCALVCVCVHACKCVQI